MKNINRKTRVFLGVATVISLASAVAGMIKVRSKYKKQDRFCEFEENDMETEDDIQFWEEEYPKEEEKNEEENSRNLENCRSLYWMPFSKKSFSLVKR